MKKLILSSLLFVSLIGVGAGAYIINGSYSPLNTAINVELGDKFGYEIVLNADSVDSAQENIYTYKLGTDKNYQVTFISNSDSSPNIFFNGGTDTLGTYYANSILGGIGVEVKSIEFDLIDDTLNSLSNYVSINNFTESSVGYFVPTSGVVTNFSIDVTQTLKVNSITVTLGI